MNPSIPAHFAADMARLPPALRAVLEGELAAGNEIAEVLCGFPVAPVGVGIRLARPLSVPVPEGTTGITPCRFPNWDGSSGYSDEPRHSFLFGPRVVPPDPPSMDEIRAAADRPCKPTAEAAPDSPLGRFERSLSIDYEKWHDGIGYDLDAIRDASPTERERIEALLLQRGVEGWREVEALAALNSPGGFRALERAKHSRKREVALAVARYAPHLLSEEELVALIVRMVLTASFFEGLTQALELAEQHHPPVVVEALLRGTLEREGDIAVHYAALLMFLHGKAESSFDWAQRPFFLTFNTDDPHERSAAFRELCRQIGVDPIPYLPRA